MLSYLFEMFINYSLSSVFLVANKTILLAPVACVFNFFSSLSVGLLLQRHDFLCKDVFHFIIIGGQAQQHSCTRNSWLGRHSYHTHSCFYSTSVFLDVKNLENDVKTPNNLELNSSEKNIVQTPLMFLFWGYCGDLDYSIFLLVNF